MPEEVSRDFAADVNAPSAAREFLRDTLQTWELDGFGEVTELLTSELVSNVVRHVAQPMTVRAIRVSADRFRIEVDDLSASPPVLQDAGPYGERGRGMLLIDALADDWGTRPRRNGKTVWFTIDAATAEDEVHNE